MEDETKVSAFDIVVPKVSKTVLRTIGKKKRTLGFISGIQVFQSSDKYCSAMFSGWYCSLRNSKGGEDG
jgi:hypothetical protein